MTRTPTTTFQCPRCGNPITTQVETLIDAQQNPDAKARLLSGRLNSVRCPNCGTVSTVTAPLVYHDNDKDLLITYTPMEINQPKDQVERSIGTMIRNIIDSLPQEKRKGYLFRPAEALTMQGLIDQVLQADGITQEMIEDQRNTVRLLEQMLQTPPDQLPALIQANDTSIDSQFVQTLTVMGQRMLQDGRQDVAQAMAIQRIVLQYSTFGQELAQQAEAQEEVIWAVTEDLQNLGDSTDLNDFVDLVITYAGDDQKLQAVVGLVRSALDYNFFEELTTRISQAPASEREALDGLRDRLLELTTLVDQQSQMAAQDSLEFLRALLNSPQPEELLRANMALVDDLFMSILTANIQEAQRRGDANANNRLTQLYNLVVSVLQENMQPELRFINQLLTIEDPALLNAEIQANAPQFGGAAQLVEVVNAVEQAIAAQGDTALLERLDRVRQALQQV